MGRDPAAVRIQDAYIAERDAVRELIDKLLHDVEVLQVAVVKVACEERLAIHVVSHAGGALSEASNLDNFAGQRGRKKLDAGPADPFECPQCILYEDEDVLPAEVPKREVELLGHAVRDARHI